MGNATKLFLCCLREISQIYIHTYINVYLSETSLRQEQQEQMSLVNWPGSMRCHIPTLTLNPNFFPFFSFFFQPTANLCAVTKHCLSRGWFHWEALPDIRGALMWLTHTHYCCLIQGLRGSCHSVFCSIGMISRYWKICWCVSNSR